MTSLRRMQMAAHVSESESETDSVDFDNSTAVSKDSGMTGISSSKSGMMSTWVNFHSFQGQNWILRCSQGSILFSVLANGYLEFTLKNTDVGGGNGGNIWPSWTILHMVSNSAPALNIDTWYHIYVGWDLANSRGWMYLNDTNILAAGGTYVNTTMNYFYYDQNLIPQWSISTNYHDSLSDYIDASMYDFYFNHTAYKDFSNVTNRRLFIKSNGKPEDLGSDGSTPTGSSPIMYLHNNAGDAGDDFKLNRGTGGDFEVQGAPLAISADSPND